jgi:hypothetical protein
MKDSAMGVPTNLDARRRMTFFANSLFMKMPKAPTVHDMISFSCVFITCGFFFYKLILHEQNMGTA